MFLDPVLPRMPRRFAWARFASVLSTLTILVSLSAQTALAGCVDEDGDGYGRYGDPSCPGGPNPDCDDTNASVYPGAPQICDGLNNDCDDPSWPLVITWSERLIGMPSSGSGWSVVASDVDVDGDVDAVFGTYAVDPIFGWYENVAGDGSNWVEHVISYQGLGITGGDALSMVDLDGDNDPDLLAHPSVGNDVLWYENAAGDGSDWVTHLVGSVTPFPLAVRAGDVDGDGDPDVVAGTFGIEAAKTVWFRNQGGSPPVWEKIEIGPVLYTARGVFVADLDGDGDGDVLVNEKVQVSWFENATGDGLAWVKHVIDDTSGGNILAEDVDGDGDPDALAANEYYDGLFWFENASECCFPRPISHTVTDVTWVVAVDLDGDHDNDVLAVSNTPGNHEVYWYENASGNGSSWTEHLLIPSSTATVDAADVNADGTMDVLAINSSHASWYQGVPIEDDDGDGDGLAECDGDCDDSRPECTNDCGDADDDGVCQDADNCPEDFNPGQEDDDGDGTGDACETSGVPALTGTGAVILALLLLIAGTGARGKSLVERCSNSSAYRSR